MALREPELGDWPRRSASVGALRGARALGAPRRRRPRELLAQRRARSPGSPSCPERVERAALAAGVRPAVARCAPARPRRSAESDLDPTTHPWAAHPILAATAAARPLAPRRRWAPPARARCPPRSALTSAPVRHVACTALWRCARDRSCWASLLVRGRVRGRERRTGGRGSTTSRSTASSTSTPRATSSQARARAARAGSRSRPRSTTSTRSPSTSTQRIEAYYHAHGCFGARVTTPRSRRRHASGSRSTCSSSSTRARDDASTPSRRRRARRARRAAPARAAIADRASSRATSSITTTYVDAARVRLESRLKALGFAWAARRRRGRRRSRRPARAAVQLTRTPGPTARVRPRHVRGTAAASPPRLHPRRARTSTQGDASIRERSRTARGRIYNLGVFSSVKVDYEHDAAHDPSWPTSSSPCTRARSTSCASAAASASSRRATTCTSPGSYLKHNLLGGLRTLSCASSRAGSSCSTPASIGGTDRRTVERPVAARRARPSRSPTSCGAWLELTWLVGYDVGIDYAYQYHGPRTSSASTRPSGTSASASGSRTTFSFLLFFNTDPALLDDPRAGGAAVRLHQSLSPRLVAGGPRARPARPAARRRTRAPTSALTLEEGGVYAGGAFAYEKMHARAARSTCRSARARDAGGARRVRADLHAGRPRQPDHAALLPRRARLAPRLQLRSPVAAGAVGAIRARPICRSAAIRWCCCRASCASTSSSCSGNWFGFAAFVDAGDVGAPSVAPPRAPTSPSLLQPAVRHHAGVPAPRRCGHAAQLAVGGGLRYRTVIGTIRVDLGVRLNRTDALRARRHAQRRSRPALRFPHLHRRGVRMQRRADSGKRARLAIGAVLRWWWRRC